MEVALIYNNVTKFCRATKTWLLKQAGLLKLVYVCVTEHYIELKHHIMKIAGNWPKIIMNIVKLLEY